MPVASRADLSTPTRRLTAPVCHALGSQPIERDRTGPLTRRRRQLFGDFSLWRAPRSLHFAIPIYGDNSMRFRGYPLV